MSTPIIEEQPQPTPAAQPQRRRPWFAVAAAALAAVVAVGGIVLFTGSDPDPIAAQPLELSLGDGPGMASCLPVSADILRDMPLAFEATAAAVEGETVTLDVTRWYTGGDAAQVVLHAPAGMQALIGGIDFEAGERYFVAATGGTVNYCGYSDVYSPQLEAIYQEAFGG